MSKKHIEKRRKNKKRNQQQYLLIFLLFVLMIAAILYPKYFAPLKDLNSEISVIEAYQMREEGAFILDVRETSEWIEKHIPGANLIPLGELALRLEEIPEGQEVVVVCRSGNRSQTGRDILLSAGLDSVTSMAGGINQWIAEGFEVEFGK